MAWRPPPVRARPPEPNLEDLELVEVPAPGPEDVYVAPDGSLFTGLSDGSIVTVSPDRKLRVIARTGGRPLGIEALGDGRLAICDARRGLLALDPASGRIETLVDAAERGIGLTNNCAVASDGTVYFSDSTTRFALEHYEADIVEHSGTGRLWRRSPEGELDLVADGLQFANGVALAVDESFVAVAQTGAYEVTRVWLEGPRAGVREPLCDGLAGFPDNLARGSDGLIWVALPAPRNPLVDLAGPFPRLRRLMWAAPEALRPRPRRVVWALALDDSGAVVREIYGREEEFFFVTGAREYAGRLYLGSVEAPYLAMASLPAGGSVS